MSSFMSFLSFHSGRSTTKQTSRKAPSQKMSISNTTKERWSQIGTTSMSSSNRSFEPSVEEMKWAFDKFDANKDGKISQEEYKSALKALEREMADSEVTKAFQLIDSDGDGGIEFKEFVEMFKMGGGPNAAEIQNAFRVFDLDGDGKISAEELSQVLKKLGESCSVKACRNMVKGVDSDGDGFINIDEFTRMMSSTRINKPT